MRTKLLFTAFALSALFASCAKEELPVVNMEPSDRAIVENVTFSETAATRLSYNGKYNFEAGDQIGACLMDVTTNNYGSSTAKWNERFDLVDYIQTNYKFTRDAEGNWETEAKMCEGNYFLAFPYNANSGLREAYSFECADQVMDGTDDAALKSAFVKNNSFVGYAKVEANDNDHESVAIDMAPVFESTGIVLFNTGSQSYTIEKIVLSGAAVSTKAVVKPSKLMENGAVKEDYITTAGNFDFDNKKVLDYTDNEKRIEVALTAGNTVESNSSIRVIVMSAPSAALTANDAVLEIHTDKGLIRGIDLSHKYTASNGDNSNTGKDAINVTTDKALGKLGAAEVVTVTFDDTSLDVPTTMNINNADELLRFIQWNSRVNKVAVTANLLANVELTAEMYNILSTEYVANGSTFAFTGDKVVTINADVEDGAIDWVKFENASVKVKGTQTITKAFATAITVNSGATLEVKAAVNATVTNKGTVNVNIAKKSNEGAAYYTINALTNEATVNVAGHALYTALNNSKKASVVNVAENTTLNVTGTNKGTVENKGILDGALVNDVYVKSGNTVLFNPTINNYSEIKAVTNNNVIVMKDQKAKVLAAAGNGEIDNTIGSKYIKTESNTVFVNVADLKASELNTVVANANATKAYVSGTLTIDPAEGKTEVAVAKLTAIVADDDLTVTGNGKVYFSADPSFTVAAGTETLVENGATLSVGSGALTVNGKLVIENNGKVICGSRIGNIENYGTMTTTKQVDVNSSQDLSNAIANGETNVYLTSGTYTIPSAAKGKALKIVGTKDVVIDATYSYGQSISGANIAFEGVTIKGQTSGNYAGFTHVEKMTFTDCVFEGKLTNYSNTEFINCTFNNKSDYAVWTSWGGTEAKFVGCTFNSGGKALLVYGGSDGKKVKNVYVHNCVFNSDKSSATDKAAIETGDDYGAEYTIEILNTTVSDNFSVTTQKKDLGGTSLGTKVWGNKDLMPSTRLNVIIDGINVY